MGELTLNNIRKSTFYAKVNNNPKLTTIISTRLCVIGTHTKVGTVSVQ